jgi:hypothetical protein
MLFMMDLPFLAYSFALFVVAVRVLKLERVITNTASTPLGRGAVREEISFYLVLWMGSAFLSSWASREL